MDASAFCTASSYKIKSLFHFLKSRHATALFRDVIHIEAVNDEEQRKVDVFYFPYGAVVCWGSSIKQAWRYLKDIKDFQDEPLATIEEDHFAYSYGEALKVVENRIILPDQQTLTKVAVSHALAQSVKLGAFEGTIANSFEKTKQIPDDLAKKGQIRLSRKEIRKKMGELFIDRSSISLHVNVLDTPEFFWERHDLEPYYALIAKDLDIETRCEVLNQRLDVMKELFEMLANEMHNQHSIRLEWIIILLILIEVVLTILTHYHLI